MAKRTLKELTDTERNNKIGMLSHIIMTTIMCMFCLLQALSGLQSALYMFVVLILGYAPIAGELYFWKKDTKTTMIKHFLAIGFAVFYTFCLFTATNNMVFIFVIPMILLVSIYNDTRYTLMINVGTVIESLLVTILGAKTGKFGYAGRDSAVIQVVIMIITALYSYLAAHTINLNLRQKLDHIRSVSRKTENAIQEIHTHLNKLSAASKATKTAMEHVNAGTADTAHAVQAQLLQTEAIQRKLEAVNAFASSMTEALRHTLAFVEDGNKDVSSLVAKVDASVEISSNAIEKLHTLQASLNKMSSISKLIDDIAFQTNLLALNANVEAARAGDAGRGFAVVASEISTMSLKTKNATEDITSLIENVSSALTDVVKVMNEMIHNTREEKQCMSHTADSFSSIQSNTFSIRERIEELAESTSDLANANQLISDSIQTISASSEEVSALADHAMASESSNAGIVDEIAEKMQKLLNDTNEGDLV